MMTIQIKVADDRLAKLRELAARVGLTPEEFLQRRVEQLIDSDEVFCKAAEYVLEKNRELYQRLARSD